jgi:plastocyanin
MDISERGMQTPGTRVGGDNTVPRRYKMRSIGIALAVMVVVWGLGVSSATAARIRILDKCDPATFNTGNTVLCKPDFDGGVTLEEFRELLSPTAFGHPAWRFNAPYVEIEPQEKVRVINRGGEDHTFTEVSEDFGGGRVDALNTPLGLTALPACDVQVAPAIHPGESVQIKGLSAGTHYFQCCIHPWMHAIIAVGSEKDNGSKDPGQD